MLSVIHVLACNHAECLCAHSLSCILLAGRLYPHGSCWTCVASRGPGVIMLQYLIIVFAPTTSSRFLLTKRFSKRYTGPGGRGGRGGGVVWWREGKCWEIVASVVVVWWRGGHHGRDGVTIDDVKGHIERRGCWHHKSLCNICLMLNRRQGLATWQCDVFRRTMDAATS